MTTREQNQWDNRTHSRKHERVWALIQWDPGLANEFKLFIATSRTGLIDALRLQNLDDFLLAFLVHTHLLLWALNYTLSAGADVCYILVFEEAGPQRSNKVFQ